MSRAVGRSIRWLIPIAAASRSDKPAPPPTTCDRRQESTRDKFPTQRKAEARPANGRPMAHPLDHHSDCGLCNRIGEEDMSFVTARPATGEESVSFLGTTKYGWRVVLFSAAGWFFDGYVINVWPLAIPFVMTDLHLTVQDIGIVTTVYVAAYTLGTLAGGTFADYVGRRSVLSFSVLVYMFVDALTAVAQGFWSLSIFRFLTGT